MLLIFSSLYTSSENFASAAVNGLPSCQVTPLRRVKVQVRPSGETSHFSARSGEGAKFPLSYLMSWLKMVLLTMRFWTAPIGGQGVTLALTGSLKLPPPAAGFAASAGLVAAFGWAAGAAG